MYMHVLQSGIMTTLHDKLTSPHMCQVSTVHVNCTVMYLQLRGGEGAGL